MKHIALIMTIFSVLMAGCVGKTSMSLEEMNSKVQHGMTVEEVKSAIGEPTGDRGSETHAGGLIYLKGDDVLIVRFVDGKCVSSEVKSTAEIDRR